MNDISCEISQKYYKGKYIVHCPVEHHIVVEVEKTYRARLTDIQGSGRTGLNSGISLRPGLLNINHIKNSAPRISKQLKVFN